MPPREIREKTVYGTGTETALLRGELIKNELFCQLKRDH
jgi:hypothetical protein